MLESEYWIFIELSTVTNVTPHRHMDSSCYSIIPISWMMHADKINDLSPNVVITYYLSIYRHSRVISKYGNP